MNKEDIYTLAELSQLQLSEEDIAEYQKGFEGILSYIDAIKSVELPKEFSQSHVVKNILRDDGIGEEPGIHTHELLGQAPHTEGDYFKVKKIL